MCTPNDRSSLQFHPDEHQGGRIDAVPQSGRLRAVREYVSLACIPANLRTPPGSPTSWYLKVTKSSFDRTRKLGSTVMFRRSFAHRRTCPLRARGKGVPPTTPPRGMRSIQGNSVASSHSADPSAPPPGSGIREWPCKPVAAVRPARESLCELDAVEGRVRCLGDEKRSSRACPCLERTLPGFHVTVSDDAETESGGIRSAGEGR